MNEDTNFKSLSSQRSGILVIEHKAFDPELAGAETTTFEQQLPQGSDLDAGTFGIFKPYIYNERNSSMSRKRWTVVDPNASAINFKFSLLEDGSVVRQSQKIVPVGTQLPPNLISTLSGQIERIDGANEKLTLSSLETFPEILSLEQASSKYEGLDISVKRQRKNPNTSTLVPGQKATHTYDVSYLTDAIMASRFNVGPATLFGVNLNDGSARYVRTSASVISPTLNSSSSVGFPTSYYYELPFSYTTADQFWNAAQTYLSLLLPTWTFEYNSADKKFTITHGEAGYVNYIRARTLRIDLKEVPYVELGAVEIAYRGTDSYMTIGGPTDTEGFSASGETENRAMTAETSVITPEGLEQITLRDWVPSVQAEQVFKKVEVVGTNETPVKSFLDIGIQDKKISVGKKLRVTYSVPEWIPFVSYEQDPDTRELITITKTIKEANGYAPTIEPRVDISAVRMDHLRVMETKKTIASSILSAEQRNTRNVQYKFPGWLTPGREFYSQLLYRASAAQNFAYTIGGFIQKPGQTLTVPATDLITYHSTQPTMPSIFQFYTSSFSAQVGFNYNILDVYLQARLGQRSVSFNDLICNSTPAVWIAYLQSGTSAGLAMNALTPTAPYWVSGSGGSWALDVELSLPESTPDASTYITMMETNYEFLAGVTIEKWKYNLWKQTRTYIKMPNLITPGMEPI